LFVKSHKTTHYCRFIFVRCSAAAVVPQIMSKKEKKLNPFRSFINKAKAKKEDPQPPTEVTNPASSVENWLHYVDDATGCPYRYNTVTGEAEWLTQEDYKVQNDQVATVEISNSPWERYYDDDGNPYYYNKVSLSS
jgi:hypothetical protein